MVATINEGSALWYNPAGLALAVKDSVDVSASAFAFRKSPLQRDTLTFSTTVALRYAYGSGKLEGLRVPDAAGAPPYLADLTVHELTLHIGSGLYF